MNVSRPVAIFAGVSTISIGGIIGSIISAHYSSTDSSGNGGGWEAAFGLMAANLLFSIYREHRQRKIVKEEAKAKEELEKRIISNMRTRVKDLSERLDKMVSNEEQSIRRRAEDYENDGL